MVNTSISDQVIEPIQNASRIIFDNMSELTRGNTAINLANLANGPTMVLISDESDLPPLSNGVHTLEIDKSYDFIKSAVFMNPISVPAGWTGRIIKSFFTSESIVYLDNNTPFFSTLFLDGNVTSISDSTTSPGIKSTITTGAPHSLLEGQFVNITDTVLSIPHIRQSLKISNVTPNTFDVEIPFTSDAIGLYNTGYGTIHFLGFGAVNNSTADFMKLKSSNTLVSAILFDRFSTGGFLSAGLIDNANVISVSTSVIGFITNALTLNNCVSGAFRFTRFLSLAGVPNAHAVIIKGSNTKRQAFINCEYILDNPTQTPFRIENTVNAAEEILLDISPDNGIATDYFDTTSGGLDQTNPQIIARNNGTREDSMASSQVGFTNVSTPILVPIITQDVPVIIGGSQYISNNLERATANAAGQVTNKTKRTQKYQITFSALAEKVLGGITDIGLLLVIDGELVLDNTFNIPHSVNAGIIQISATRSFELAENTTIDIAVVNFNGTDNISITEANMSYSQKA